MRIVEFTAYIVRLPLKQEIRHAAASRSHSDSLIVRCSLADGTIGWGEGVPREYVTGENVERALLQWSEAELDPPFRQDCHDWRRVVDMCEEFRPRSLEADPRGHHGHSLRCAVELSVLDAFAKYFREPLSHVTRHFAPADDLLHDSDSARYSTIIRANSDAEARRAALFARLQGFKACKVGVAIPGTDDVKRVASIRRWLGHKVDLRVDANQGWSVDSFLRRIEALMPSNISSVEQPIRHAEIGALSELRPKVPVPIVLDESLTSEIDACAAIDNNLCDIFNLRLSKCGGFLKCLRLASMAHRAGLAFQLGYHPGESGILAAAGRHWATSVRGIRYLEGSNNRHLMDAQLTNEDVTHGRGGLAPALRSHGLGVTVNLDVLQKLLIRQSNRRLA